MAETVRVVSDGDEMLLSKGESYRVRRDPADAPLDRRAPAKPAPRLAVQYRGFRDAEGRREYLLDAQRGDEVRRYTLWIELAAFSGQKVRLQDGPDICYQRLLRELADSAMEVSDRIAITEGELTSYRESHAPPVRRGFSAPRPQSPETPEAKAAPGNGGETS